MLALLPADYLQLRKSLPHVELEEIAESIAGEAMGVLHLPPRGETRKQVGAAAPRPGREVLSAAERENDKLRVKAVEATQQVDALREKYLREIMSLREVGYQMGRGNRDFVEYLNVHYFDEQEGLEPALISLLNSRIRPLKKLYESNLNELRARNAVLTEKIELYKQMAPVDYPLLDISLPHIFTQLALIHRDPLTVWQAFQRSYPTGLLADLVGGGSSKENARLQRELEGLAQEWRKKWEDMRQ